MSGTFEHSEVNETQKTLMKGFARRFAKLAADVDGCVPNGRYKFLAFTALETAAMWVNKAISKP